jgi:hypothetical protein
MRPPPMRRPQRDRAEEGDSEGDDLEPGHARGFLQIAFIFQVSFRLLRGDFDMLAAVDHPERRMILKARGSFMRCRSDGWNLPGIDSAMLSRPPGA